MILTDNSKNMVQYGIWNDCCNNCKFCLREDRRPYSKEEKLFWLDAIKDDVKRLDWENQFSYGISLMGGELYFITDKDIQDSFMELIDVIIEKVLRKSKNPDCRYSTVTNGLYEPTFLYRVIDRIKDTVGIGKVDINFSYDLKYRFANEDRRLLCLNNINNFHKKYNYNVGVQMILTQYVIDLWKEGKFDINRFEQEEIPGNQLCFLYPHPIQTGIKLDDFNFKRSDFIRFIMYMKEANERVYTSFLRSTKNSCSFKYTGLRDRAPTEECLKQKPRLSDGKEIINERCGHSILYKCYTDSDKCVLCDLMNLDRDAYL